jgi:hypothetical protein
MECKIKIIAGPEAGQEFAVGSVETYLGRSPRCAVKLGNHSISYEHAVISREGDEYFIENLSANGTLVNSDRITAKTRLRARDQIRLGQETMLRVESLPATSRSGGSRRTLLVALLLVMIAGAAVVLLDPFSSSASYNWAHAYAVFQPFVERQVQAHQLAPESADVFRDAWRHQQAGDKDLAAKDWIKMRVLLEDSDPRTNIRKLNRERGVPALASILNANANAPDSSDEDLYAALLQFVMLMEQRR